MELQASTPSTPFPWKRCIHLTLLLVQLSLPEVRASCQILRCNSDFVAATMGLSGAGAAAGGVASSRAAVNAGYCGALRSYAVCTRRMARPCRGDLAYHSAVHGIEDLLVQHHCPPAGPTAQPPPRGTLSADACHYEKSFLSREHREPEYLHCSIFGHPHIRTFNDDFQTCAVQGAWPVIDNEYLYVQVTSSPAKGRAFHTVITKITVIFKNWRECIDQQLYQAELDHVPAAFADGSVSGLRSLTVQPLSPGRHVTIEAQHIGTRLVVRQSGRSLGLAVRAPRGVVEAFGPEQDLQLCVWGCPPARRLNTLLPQLPGSSPTAVTAKAHCAALLPAQDVYFQACVFDLVTGGDLNSSMAAGALQDAQNMIPDRDAVHLQLLADASRPPPRLLLLLLSMLGTLGGA